jgi:hypothetical protein
MKASRRAMVMTRMNSVGMMNSAIRPCRSRSRAMLSLSQRAKRRGIVAVPERALGQVHENLFEILLAEGQALERAAGGGQFVEQAGQFRGVRHGRPEKSRNLKFPCEVAA